MIFKQRRIAGQSRQCHKEWRDETKTYKIVWTNEVYGVRVPGHYHAVVRIVFPEGREMWDFVGRRGAYKTRRKAEEAAEKHRKLWEKGLESSGIRQLQEVFGGKLPIGMPIWAKKKIRRDLYEILTNSIQLRRHGTRRTANYADQAECRGSDLQEEQSALRGGEG